MIHTMTIIQSYNHTLICFGMVSLVDNQCSCCNVLCVWEIFATFAAKALLNFWEYINSKRPLRSNYDICQKYHISIGILAKILQRMLFNGIAQFCGR